MFGKVSRDTATSLGLWTFHQMADGSSPPQKTTPFVYGTCEMALPRFYLMTILAMSRIIYRPLSVQMNNMSWHPITMGC